MADPLQPSYASERMNGHAVASTDWDDDFETYASSLTRFFVPTEGGSLQMFPYSTSYPVRHILQFEADLAYDAKGLLIISGTTNVQLKFNKKISNYTAGVNALTLSVRKGMNTLRIAHDGQGNAASLEINLWTQDTGRFLRASFKK